MRAAAFAGLAAFAVGTSLLLSILSAKAQSPAQMCRAITDAQLRQSCFEKIKPKQALPVRQSTDQATQSESITDRIMDYGWIVFAAIAVLLWVAAIVLKRRREKRQLLARYSELMSKYNDQQIVAAIMEGKIWQGMAELWEKGSVRIELEFRFFVDEYIKPD